MNDGTTEEWAALERLLNGDGSRADRDMLARDFREHHLSPEHMSVPTALWLDICLKALIDGAPPAEAFKLKKPGRPQQYTAGFKAFATLRYLQEKRKLTTDAAREVILNEFSRSDWRNFERDILLGDFGSRWTDEEVDRRIENYRGLPRVI